ncbi:hypothetical protein ASPVEDRAFT_45482 [Aspergillus versicolor CBS 583.65]|uniref:Uncharacterized protein n=1 Tax=Aspergillus versicolor CBS 583.65 TaxID=1036611 RepID=A0A1L9PX84_ASPVE|nr:uncharacterized protein ASPVEDRAFT_45482 [Aspergillus versicolor CBS 583.65]OJJ06065.1 hypothetical protein ASPVEDRAFT_45482 [Aspergillus versicolor CBS 583.65]
MYSDLVLDASAARCHTLAGGGRGGCGLADRTTLRGGFVSVGLEGLWGQTIGRNRAGSRSDAHAQLLARSQRYRRSSRDGQAWRGSTSVSLMREGGVQEPQRLNWNSRSTDRKATNKHSGMAMLRKTGCAGRTRALMMIPASKMDRLSREEMVVTGLWLKRARTER